MDLTFVLGDTKVRLPAANSTFQRKARMRRRSAAAATRVKYKIVHKKIIQIAAAGSLMYTQVLMYTHLHSCTASTPMYTNSESEPRPDSDADAYGRGTSHGTVTSSHDSHVDESLES